MFASTKNSCLAQINTIARRHAANQIRLKSHLGGPKFTVHQDPKKLPEIALAEPDTRFHGEIVTWVKSFGFIRNKEHNETIFFHLKNCDMGGFIKFQPGQRVTFQVSKNERGPCADKIRPMVQKFNSPTILDIETKEVVTMAAAV